MTDTQQHTDSPATGDGGVVVEWEEIYGPNGRLYRCSLSDSSKIQKEWWWMWWDVDESDPNYKWLCMITSERQHHRQREAQLREVVKERQTAITEAVSRAGLDPIDGAYFTGQQVVIDELRAILSPDDATGEV